MIINLCCAYSFAYSVTQISCIFMDILCKQSVPKGPSGCSVADIKRKLSMKNSCEWRVPKMWGQREGERMSLTCLQPFVHRPLRPLMWVCEAHFLFFYFFVWQGNVRCIWSTFRCTWIQEKYDARSNDSLWVVQTDSFHGAHPAFGIIITCHFIKIRTPYF